MDFNSISAAQSTGANLATTSTSDPFSDLRSEDFLKLLVTQLTSQDPFEPTGNEELFRQISSIRDIELSTTLTKSLETLTGQQRFTSASTLIGQHVTSLADESGQLRSGIVVGVRFDGDGQALVRLANGAEIPLEQISTVLSPLEAAKALIGSKVSGVDGRDPAEPKVVQGVVTAARQDELGDVILELDTGESLRFRDVTGVTSADD